RDRGRGGGREPALARHRGVRGDAVRDLDRDLLHPALLRGDAGGGGAGGGPAAARRARAGARPGAAGEPMSGAAPPPAGRPARARAGATVGAPVWGGGSSGAPTNATVGARGGGPGAAPLETRAAPVSSPRSDALLRSPRPRSARHAIAAVPALGAPVWGGGSSGAPTNATVGARGGGPGGAPLETRAAPVSSPRSDAPLRSPRPRSARHAIAAVARVGAPAALLALLEI